MSVWIVDVGFVVVGIVLLIWARPLSLRYNAFTTRFRERHPKFNPPPTPEMRALNTKIFAVILRIMGAFFVLRGLVGILADISLNR